MTDGRSLMEAREAIDSAKYAIELMEDIRVRLAKSLLPGPKLPVPKFEFRYSDEYGNEIAVKWGYSTLGPHAESPENVRDPSSTGMSPESPASPLADTPQNPPTFMLPDSRKFQRISVLKLAKGWEEKLIAAGVQMVGQLEDFINDGKLVPGFAPRIGPDAVEKIKAALAKAGDVIVEATNGMTAAELELPSKTPEQIKAEGAEFARLGYKSSENPYQRGTSIWHLWDRGWQEWFATHDADDEATREDVPATPESTPDVPAEEFPEMDLTAKDAAPAAASASPVFDTSDL